MSETVQNSCPKPRKSNCPLTLNNKMRFLHAAPVHSTVLGSDVTEEPLRSRRKQNVAQ